MGGHRQAPRLPGVRLIEEYSPGGPVVSDKLALVDVQAYSFILQRVSVADVPLAAQGLEGGVDGRLSASPPGAEVGQRPPRLTIDDGILEIVEPDVDDRVAQVRRESHRVDVWRPLGTALGNWCDQGMRRIKAGVGSAAQEPGKAGIVEEPQPGGGGGCKAIVVGLLDHQESAVRCRRDRRLRCVRIQGSSQRPRDEVARCRHPDCVGGPEIGVVDPQVAARRVGDHLEGFHRATGAVA